MLRSKFYFSEHVTYHIKEKEIKSKTGICNNTLHWSCRCGAGVGIERDMMLAATFGIHMIDVSTCFDVKKKKMLHS